MISEEKRIKKNEYAARYRLRHPERVSASRERFEARHPGKIEEYREKNFATHRAATKAWRENNHEEILTYNRKWQKENPEKRRIHEKNTRRKNPKLYRRIGAMTTGRRRARMAGAVGLHTQAQWFARIAFHGWKCFYCAQSLSIEKITKDHAIPIARGGTDYASNLLPACARCNSSKGKQTIFEYLRKLAA